MLKFLLWLAQFSSSPLRKIGFSTAILKMHIKLYFIHENKSSYTLTEALISVNGQKLLKKGKPLTTYDGTSLRH